MSAVDELVAAIVDVEVGCARCLVGFGYFLCFVVEVREGVVVLLCYFFHLLRAVLWVGGYVVAAYCYEVYSAFLVVVGYAYKLVVYVFDKGAVVADEHHDGSLLAAYVCVAELLVGLGVWEAKLRCFGAEWCHVAWSKCHAGTMQGWFLGVCL